MLPGLSFFPSLASVISSVWESNQSAVLLVFLLKMEKVALLKFSHQSHALPLCAPGKDSSSAHANSSTLPCSRDLLMSKRGLPSFFVWYSYFDGHFALLHSKEGFVSHSALRLLVSGENQVKLVPVLRSWVSPGDCVGACYWRTRSWNRVCDEGIALEGLGCFRSSSQCRNNPSKWAMTFGQHQLWRWSHREWTVSNSFSVIPLMVIASSWYNLSFASPGDIFSGRPLSERIWGLWVVFGCYMGVLSFAMGGNMGTWKFIKLNVGVVEESWISLRLIFSRLNSAMSRFLWLRFGFINWVDNW